MRIAITGASGFIGGHVRKALSKSGHEIVLVSRKPESLKPMAANETVVEIDFHRSNNDWFNSLGQPDVVLHLAWSGLPNYLDTHHLEVEYPAQIKFLTQLIQNGLKKLVVTGTCYEYGLCSGAILESQMTMPNTPYGVAKDLLRKSLEELKKSHEFELTWARVFYPYGDGQAETSLFTQLKTAAVNGKTRFDMGGGKQVLDFISVDEVAKILVNLSIENSKVGVLNIGSGKPKSVIEFVNEQIQKNKWLIRPKIGAIPDREYEPHSFWADTSKLDHL